MNNNISRINKIGKAAKIVLAITNACISILTVMLIVLCGFICFIPSSAITVSGTADAEIVIDYDKAPMLKGDVEIGESEYNQYGFFLKVSEAVDNNLHIAKINGSMDKIDVEDFKYVAVMGILTSALLSAALLVVSIFAQRLAKSISRCESPFEDKVIRSMKQLGFALIPWAVLNFINGGIGLLTGILIVLVVLLVAYVFSYGAKIQQENDDMV